MIGEFTPVSQRGAVISIYGALYTLAGILAPFVMGNVIQGSATLLDGYMTGFTINAVSWSPQACSAWCCCGPTPNARG